MGEAIVAVMFTAIASCWVAICLRVKHASELKDSRVRLDIQILVAGVVSLTAFMPGVRSGSISYYSANSSPFLTVIFGLEAGLCLALNAMRIRCRDLIWRNWQMAALATAVHGGLI